MSKSISRRTALIKSGAIAAGSALAGACVLTVINPTATAAAPDRALTALVARFHAARDRAGAAEQLLHEICARLEADPKCPSISPGLNTAYSEFVTKNPARAAAYDCMCEAGEQADDALVEIFSTRAETPAGVALKVGVLGALLAGADIFIDTRYHSDWFDGVTDDLAAIERGTVR